MISLPYPQDIEAYYKHPLRNKHYNDEITILFANRLISRYNPLLALNVYKRLKIKYPNIKLMMNAEGSLRSDCDEFILNNELKDVCFLEKITSWNDMHLIYKNADILILPCSYSNGNGSIIEARASGMGIVISHQINNVQKHSIDKENCFICELNEEAFVDGVSKYLDNPQLIDEHGKISRKLVEYKLNDNIAKEYYEALLKHGFF